MPVARHRERSNGEYKDTINARTKSNFNCRAAKHRGGLSLNGKGDLAKLNTAFNRALDAGLTINESKEVLVHLYA